jgi:hypothetical protein
VSGYLQRLAARALNAREAIHPVVGSIFAPAATGGNQPSFILEEDEQMTVAPEPVAGSASTSPFPPSRADVKPVEIPPDADELLVPPEQSPAPRQPAIVRPADASAQNDTAVEPNRAAQLQPEPIDTRGAPTVAPRFLRVAHSAGQTTSPRASARAANGAPRDVPAPAQDRQPRPVLAPALHHPPAPHREQDEIQIHIGRIEVTAVPPGPAGAPPARPPRTAPDLAVYLKKGDRRAK